MRRFSCFVILAAMFFTSSSFAGDVTVGNGQVTWVPTKCAVPVVPPVLSGVGSEDAANDVNVRITQYNEYLLRIQSYMECLSNEAEADAGAVSTAITSAAQKHIAEVHNNAKALGAGLKNK